ncbi:MAG: cytochrome c [Kordiimonadaceae bacterium]|nr:cytochrome c [Kordiimonadaceae bacterium]
MRFLLSIAFGLISSLPAYAAAAVAGESTPAPLAAQVVKEGMAAAVNGKKFYRKCSACHRATGEGIPGSFPSLNKEIDTLASSEDGRSYLVAVVYNGLRGKLETQNGTFRGVMVRQAGGKSPADVADLLNYIVGTFYKDSDVTAFNADEVKAITTAQGRLGSNKVLALRPKAQ